jgi:membrane protease YdiL (CAAX protease family)
MNRSSPQNDKSSRRPFIVIGLIIILGIEFIIRDVFLPIPASDLHIRIALSIEWLMFLGLILYWIPRVERTSGVGVGLGKFKWRYLGLGVVTYLAFLVVSMMSGFAMEALGLPSIRSLQPMIKQYSWATLAGLFLTGTLVEEIFYRGYLINRVTYLTNNKWLAGVVSWLAFTLVHLRFFGLGPTLDVSVLAAVLVFIYLKENSVWPCMVVHGINGVLAYLIFPLVIT